MNMVEWRLLLRVAGEETSRYFRGFNRRVLLFIVFAGLAGGLLFPVILDRGVVPDERLYRVDSFPGSPYLVAARDARQFEVREDGGLGCLDGTADLCFMGDRIVAARTKRGEAAHHDFEEFLERYLDRALEPEANESAAFPVAVHVVYQGRQLTNEERFQAQFAPRPTGPGVGEYTNPDVSLVLNQTDEVEPAVSPGRVEVPFPMESLLLTFVYLIPLNFVGQYYAGSLLGERTRYRGVLLLSAPLSGAQILAGKTLPYVAFAALFSLVATLLLQAGTLAFLATLPIFGFFLAATCFAALLARSYRELTFFVTTMSVALSTYLFLPAIFTQIHPIAFISPISVVAAGIRGEAVPLLSFLYSITPLTLAGLVLAALAAALYREESLFAPKRILSKILDAVHTLTPRRWNLLVAGALVLPFVFGLELLILAFAASFRPTTALGVFLVGVALIEELAKALPAAAHYRRAVRTFHPNYVGFLVGTGFFFGEKLALLFSLVGLDLAPLGPQLLTAYGVTTSILFLFAPWALHVATTVLTAHAARRRLLGVGILASILLHVLYNAAVIRAAT